MQAVFRLLITSITTMILAIVVTREIPGKYYDLFQASLAVLLILSDYNEMRWSFSEIKGQKFRMVSYGLSLFLFLLCLLSAVDVITLTHIEPGMSMLKKIVNAVLAIILFVLMVINVGFVVRDVGRRDQGLGI